MDSQDQDAFWTQRYKEGNTGWDVGSVTTPLKEYIDQLKDKSLHILIPGAGNGYEAEYLWNRGFTNATVLDISRNPLESFADRVPSFPPEQLIHGDFFTHEGQYDLVLEQTFFCSFEPTVLNRSLYAERVAALLREGGKLVGLWFKHPYILGESKRPFGGSKEEYLSYFEPFFDIQVFEDCYNSIPPRAGNELFGIFRKN